MEREIAWLNSIVPQGSEILNETDSHHGLLSKAYEVITHAIDTYGSESQEYLDACSAYGRRLLCFWGSQMSGLQSRVAPKTRTPYEQDMDNVRHERILDYEELPQDGDKRRFLRTTEGNFSLFADTKQVPRMDIFMQIGNPQSSAYEQFSLRVLDGRIDEIDAPKIISRKDDTYFEVILRMGAVNTITRSTDLSGVVQDKRTIRRLRGFGKT
ncbi:hypothetical protein KKE03_04465 [Patescibacteria group bacterium]|nr:hypothetical protein [Patescibacteria group bacterium]